MSTQYAAPDSGLVEPNGYTRKKWFLRTKTLHRKLVELTSDIEQFDGESAGLFWKLAGIASDAVAELETALDRPRRR